MYEVEVKVPADHGPVRERLEALGADPLGVVHQHDTYYDHPTRDFAETDEALRLRRESTPDDQATAATLTYKGPLVDDATKTREEVETGVSEPDAADTVLTAVGFEPAAVVEKERERFVLEGYTVALDTVSGLGTYVEVEATGEAEGVESIGEGAFDLCRRLGLAPDESIRTAYLGLLLEGE